MLPLRPQSLEELRQRYPLALKNLFDCRGERAKRLRPRPGELYSCIFDFEDGLRLIISRELYDHEPEPARWLHISASVANSAELLKQFPKPDDTQFIAFVTRRVFDLSGERAGLQLMGTTDLALHLGRRLEQ